MTFDAAPIQLSLIESSAVAAPDMVATVEEGLAAFKAIFDLPTELKIGRAMSAIDAVFESGHPVCVSYSAGKDSTVLLYLVVEVACNRLAAGKPVSIILVTHANTGIENPAYAKVAEDEIERVRAYAKLRALPLRVDVVQPALNDSWAVRIISGRALPTFPNSKDRDCSTNWKVIPQERQRKAALEELADVGQPVVMTGTRFEESDVRYEAMMRRGERDTEIWTKEVRNNKGKLIRKELQLSPICMFSQEDVWVILAELQSGERASFTDAADVWSAYRDGGGTSCAVVSDDAMKASAKACGARFGCALCAAVGRDKSLEAMIEADPSYAFMRSLNRIQRFIVDTQYDASRRQWIGRTLTSDGYLAIGPDAYSPAMQLELLRYALTADRDERDAARRLGIRPRFQLVSEEQLFAIDIIWSINRTQKRSFEALRAWQDVYNHGKSYYPPKDLKASDFPKKLPGKRWLYVGASYDSDAGYSDVYSGGRSALYDLTGAGESAGCSDFIELAGGNKMLAVERADFFQVDAEGIEYFLAFNVGEEDILNSPYAADPGWAYEVLRNQGVFQTFTRHQISQDKQLRRADWRRRHGVEQMSTAELLARCVTETERKAGLKCPEGMTTLPDDFQARLAADHARREATAWRPNVVPLHVPNYTSELLAKAA